MKMVSSPSSNRNSMVKYSELRRTLVWPKDFQNGRQDISGKNILLDQGRKIISCAKTTTALSQRESKINPVSYGTVQPSTHSPEVRFAKMDDEVRLVGYDQVKRYGTVSLVGFAVEFTWAALEGCIIPYLLWQGVPVETVGFIFLANPILALILTGWVGKKSDKLKARKPFIVALCITGMIGLLILAFSRELGSMFANIFMADREHMSIAFTFIGYLIADVSNDVLLIPGRSYAGDIASKYASKNGIDNDAENANSIFTIMQTSGRLLSLVLGSVAVETALPSRTCTASEKRCSHLQALCKLAFLILGISCIFAVSCSASEQQQKEEFAEIEIGTRAQTQDGDIRQARESEPLIQPLLGRERKRSGVLETGVNLLYTNPSLFLILSSQIIGWIEIMVLSFYWTAWLGETAMAFAGLAGSALVALMTSLILKKLNHFFGEVVIYFCGEVSMCICLFCSRFIEPNIQSVVLCGLTGFMYASHQTNSFIIAEISLPDSIVEQHQSMIVAVLQSSMPLAQVLVAGFSGLLIALADNQIEVFISFVGLFGLIIQSLLAVQYIRCQNPRIIAACTKKDEVSF